MVYTSAGKAFSLTGLCSANLIVPDKTLRELVMNKIREAWIMSPNIFGFVATKAAYEHGEDWLNAEHKYLEENSDFACEFIAKHLPGVSIARHEGTFMMWLGFAGFGLSDDELADRMVNVCGLGLGVGNHYGKQFGQYMRLNIGCARPVLERAKQNMCNLK